MNKTFIEGAGIKQLAAIKFTHSLLDGSRCLEQISFSLSSLHNVPRETVKQLLNN